jgi:opacity protein-like surface antigen
MSRRVIALAALAAALVTAPAAVEAQSPVRFGIAAGATFPTGNAGDLFDWGYHLNGIVSGRPAVSPVGLRGEVMFHSLQGKEIDAGEFGSVDVPNARIIAGLVNAEIGLSGTGLRPYFIGGLGMYNIGGEDIDSETKFGFNLGGGIEFMLSGLSTFAEIRYHNIMTDGESTNIIPISFGIKF